jgi:hypothetical protein
MEGINNQVVPPGDPIHRLRALNNLHLPGPEKGGTSEPIASNASNPLSSDLLTSLLTKERMPYYRTIGEMQQAREEFRQSD